MQSSHDPDGLQPNAANWSRIGPNRSRTGAHPKWSRGKISAQNPGNAGTVFCNPGDCGGLGSLAPCEPGTTARIEDRMQMQGNRFRTATKTSGQQS